MDILQFLLSAEQAGSYVEKTLIAAIVADPSDTTAISAYGDYLEEHARTLAARIVRGKGFSDKVAFALRLLPNTQVTEVIASGHIVAELQGVGPGMLWLQSHPNQNHSGYFQSTPTWMGEPAPQAVATGFIPPRTGSVVSGMLRSGAGYLVPLASGLIGGGSEMGCLTQEQNQQRLSAFFRDILPQKKDNQ